VAFVAVRKWNPQANRSAALIICLMIKDWNESAFLKLRERAIRLFR